MNDQTKIDEGGKFIYNSLGIAVFTFGKHKDQPVFKEMSYLDWMLSAKNDDGTYKFSHDTRNWCGIFKKGERSTNNITTEDTKNPRYSNVGINYRTGARTNPNIDGWGNSKKRVDDEHGG